MTENEPDDKSRHKHVKPVNVLCCSHSNSDIESDNTYDGTTYASTKHNVYNKYLTTFDQTTVSSLQNHHFRLNVINFFLDTLKKTII